MKKYTAYFEAESQQALYDMMVASIGEAVQGRILQRTAEPVAPTVVRHDGANLPPLVPGAITVSNDPSAPKKRGRKPGQKVGPYKKKENYPKVTIHYGPANTKVRNVHKHACSSSYRSPY